MKYVIFSVAFLCAIQASADTLSGNITKVKDNVAYLHTSDGKKIPIILTDKTYYRKKKVYKRGKRTADVVEFQPLVNRGDEVTLTYDADTVDKTSGAVRASDVLITVTN